MTKKATAKPQRVRATKKESHETPSTSGPIDDPTYRQGYHDGQHQARQESRLHHGDIVLTAARLKEQIELNKSAMHEREARLNELNAELTQVRHLLQSLADHHAQLVIEHEGYCQIISARIR